MDIKKFIYDLEQELPEMYEEKDIVEIVKKVIEKFNVVCDYFCAGSYDSCGYDCDYYNVVWYVDGKLESANLQVESY